jgi:Uma2 family endonuclease
MKARTTAASADPTVYPEEERVGESMLQRRIVELLRPLLEWWLNVKRGGTAFVGADQFNYWRQYDPHARIAPDVYVIPGVARDGDPKAWKLWIDAVVPSFALEVVSDDWQKDYEEAPPRYEELGVREVVLVDPGHATHADGVLWQVYRPVKRRGLVCVEATNADRVRSKVLGCWLRAVGEGKDFRVRIAEGPKGEVLVPTAEERERAERAAKETERAARQAAEARVAELERELARLRGLKRSR